MSSKIGLDTKPGENLVPRRFAVWAYDYGCIQSSAEILDADGIILRTLGLLRTSKHVFMLPQGDITLSLQPLLTFT